MPESLKTRLTRIAYTYLFPAYAGTGGRITYVSRDWREVHVAVPLSWRTRNYVGTIFGGSLYGAVDPIYMVMLIRALGPEYVVWDKAASVRFRRPGRSTLRARFVVTDEELDAIRSALETERSIERVYTIRLTADDGTVCCEVEKTIHVRRKDAAPGRGPSAEKT
jgi:acyl-coenzyme A thioesterase PaaI-like protein